MITWNESFATGVPQVDEEHRQLIALLNALEDVIARGRGPQVVAGVVENLTRYTARHFAFEEGCMHRFQCPQAAANRDAHQEFLAMLAKTKADVVAGHRTEAVQELHRELCAWIICHVLTIDTALRGCRQPATAPDAVPASHAPMS